MSKRTPQHKINRAPLSALAKKAKAGDKKALEKLVNLCSDYIFYYCLSLLRNDEKARDAAQDILVILIDKIDTLENPDAFLGWVKVITSNYCKTIISCESRELPLEASQTYFDDDVNLSPPKKLEADELRRELINAVGGLSELHRECILMRYYQDMSVSQIAELLGVSEGTIKSRLYYARKYIKERLRKKGFDSTTLSGASPLSYLAYSLIEDSYRAAENTRVKLPVQKPCAPSASSQAATFPGGSRLAVSLSSAGKTAAVVSVKAAVIAAAATLAAGTTVAFTAGRFSAGAPAENKAFLKQTETSAVSGAKAMSEPGASGEKLLATDKLSESYDISLSAEYLLQEGKIKYTVTNNTEDIIIGLGEAHVYKKNGSEYDDVTFEHISFSNQPLVMPVGFTDSEYGKDFVYNENYRVFYTAGTDVNGGGEPYEKGEYKLTVQAEIKPYADFLKRPAKSLAEGVLEAEFTID